jgi:hypothetical protein
MKVLFLITYILAFGYRTHTFLGNIIDEYLVKFEPELYDKVLFDLNYQTISNVSTWADRVKRRQPWSKKLHYIDIIECNKVITPEIEDNNYCNEGECIVSAIKEFSNKIKDYGKFKYNNFNFFNYDNFNFKYINYNLKFKKNLSKEDLLKFLIHFLQDFNQPMHLLGYQRGGNDLKIVVNHKNRNKTTNLHNLWDNIIPEYYTKFYFKKNQIEIPVSYETIQEVIYRILNRNLPISCLIYPKTEYIIFEEYFNKEQLKSLFNNYIEITVLILRLIYLD